MVDSEGTASRRGHGRRLQHGRRAGTARSPVDHRTQAGVVVWPRRNDGASGAGMTERRWRVSSGPGRGLFLIEVDDGRGFRPATAAEIDSALRQRELFGAADYPGRNLGGGPPNQPAPLPAGRDGREEE